MSLLYDESQQAIAMKSRRALEARMSLDAQLPLLETQGAYDKGFWTLAREQGWTALTLHEDYGGIGLGLIELGLVALQAGRSLSGAPFVTTSLGAASALTAYGSDQLGNPGSRGSRAEKRSARSPSQKASHRCPRGPRPR